MSKILNLLFLLPLVACSPENASNPQLSSEAFIQSESGIIGSPDVLSAQVTGDTSLTLTVKSTSADLRTSSVILQDGTTGFSVLTSTCDSYNKVRSCSAKIKFTSAGKANGLYQDAVIIEDLVVPVQVTLAKPGNDDTGIQVTVGSEIVPTIDFGTLSSSQTISKVLIIKDTAKKTTQTATLSLVTTNFQLLTTTCSSVLLNGAGCSVRLQFYSTGKQPNTYTDILKVGSREFPVTALIPSIPVVTGLPDIKFLNSSDAIVANQNFGDIAAMAKTSVVIKLKNQGTATAVSSSAVSLSGTGAAAFYLSGSTCNSALAVNGTCSVVLNVSPGSLRGSQTASLSYAGTNLPLSLNILGEVVVQPPVKYTLTLNTAMPSGILASAGVLTVKGQTQTITNHIFEITAGETVNLSFSANSAQGLVFGGWTGSCTGSSENCSVVMDSNKTVSLVLSKAQYTLTLIQPYMFPMNSLSSVTTTYTHGETAEVSLSYMMGMFRLNSWSSVCSQPVGSSCQLVMDSDKTVSVDLSDRPGLVINIDQINNGLPLLVESTFQVTGSTENIPVGTELTVAINGQPYFFTQPPKVKSGQTFSFEILAPPMAGNQLISITASDTGAVVTSNQYFETRFPISLSLNPVPTIDGFIYSGPLSQGESVSISGSTQNVLPGTFIYVKVQGMMSPVTIGSYQAIVEANGGYSINIPGSDFSSLQNQGYESSPTWLVVRASFDSSMLDSESQTVYYRDTPILDGGFVYNMQGETIQEIFLPTLAENIQIKLTSYFSVNNMIEGIPLDVRILNMQGGEIKKYENAVIARSQDPLSIQIPLEDLSQIPAGTYRVVVEHAPSKATTAGAILIIRDTLPEINMTSTNIQQDPQATVLKTADTPLSFTLGGDVNKGNRMVSVKLINGATEYDLGNILTQAGATLNDPDTFIVNIPPEIFNALTLENLMVELKDKTSNSVQMIAINNSICAAHDPNLLSSTLSICSWVTETQAIGWTMQGGKVAGKNPVTGATSKWMVAAYSPNASGSFDTGVITWGNYVGLQSKTTGLGLDIRSFKPSYTLSGGVITSANDGITGEAKQSYPLTINAGIIFKNLNNLPAHYACASLPINGFTMYLPNAAELSKIVKKLNPSVATGFAGYSSTEIAGIGIADSKQATDLIIGQLIPLSVTSIRPEANELVIAVRQDGSLVRSLKGNQLCSPVFIGSTMINCGSLVTGNASYMQYCYRNF